LGNLVFGAEAEIIYPILVRELFNFSFLGCWKLEPECSIRKKPIHSQSKFYRNCRSIQVYRKYLYYPIYFFHKHNSLKLPA